MEASDEKHLCFSGAHLLFHDVVASTVLSFSAAFSPLCPPSVSSFLCCAFGFHWWPPHCSGGTFRHKPFFFFLLPLAVSDLAAATKVEQSCACALGAATCGKSKAIKHIVPPRLVVESCIYLYIYIYEKERKSAGRDYNVCVHARTRVCACPPLLFFK